MTTRYKLGLIHDHRPCPVPDLATFSASSPLPSPATEVPAPPVEDWEMACNDQEGDCTIAGVVHDDLAWSEITAEPYTYCGDPLVHSTYRGLTGGSDTGLLIDDVLNTWATKGLACSSEKIDAWAPVNPRNTTAVKQAVDFFGVCKMGVALPAIAQEQFQDGEPWDLTGTSADYDIEGGHDVEAVAYDEDLIIVTWGRLQRVTWRWFVHYTQQARAIIPGQFVERGGDARGLNIDQMKAAVHSLAA